jgi:Matrixin
MDMDESEDASMVRQARLEFIASFVSGNTSGALTVSGHSTITIAGLLQVDSSSASAVQAKGNAQVQPGSIQVVGGVSTTGHATVSPSPVTHVASVPDPLLSLPVPTGVPLAAQPLIRLSGSQSMTIDPGIYREITVSGRAKLTLNPGIYVIAGGGFTVTGHASVKGATGFTDPGVLIYNAGSNYIVKHDEQGDHDGQHYFGMGRPSSGNWNYGGITISGDGTINLSAATAGTYAGVVIFQARDNPRAIELDGHATVALLNSTIYAKGALLDVSGDSQVTGTLVVDRLKLNGDAGSSLSADGSSSTAEGVAGELVVGDLFVYVNDPNGLFTADELARIQDAIAGMNPLLAPYNVVITQVDAASSDQANVIIDIGTSTAAGGYADGVLGCETTSTGSSEITLVQGWNWYDGTDSTAVASDQFDFQTVVTHELGHALGLGHNPDGSSVMYASLATGAARRSLTVTDLNIPDPGTGTDGLHAAVPVGHVVGGLTANIPAPTGSNGVAALDEVLSVWNRTDTGFSRGVAKRVSGQGSQIVVQPLVATRSTPSDHSGRVVDPNSAEVLFAQGGSTRSLFGGSTPPIRKKLFGSSTL